MTDVLRQLVLPATGLVDPWNSGGALPLLRIFTPLRPLAGGFYDP